MAIRRAACWFACLLLVALPGPARAIVYRLQIANLHDDAFSYFIRGKVTRAEGELAMPGLERALDAGEVGAGALLYDRDLEPAGPAVARAFGARPPRAVPVPPAPERSQWKTVAWDGAPGERVVWVVRPATSRWRQASRLALAGPGGELRYFLPYTAATPPQPARAVTYPLAFLRTSEEGAPLWEKELARSVDVTGGLAAVVGVNDLGGDWVYLVLEPPAQPGAFRAVVGWQRRGPNDRVQEPGRRFPRRR